MNTDDEMLESMASGDTGRGRNEVSSASLKEPPIYERQKALDRVRMDAAAHWRTLPSSWQASKDFILQALQYSPTLPPKSEFERKFKQPLRFDRQVILAFCQRADFLQLFEERHLFVPGSLNGDKEIMMAYCQKVPRSLQECTEDLCNDRDVVREAVTLGGLELQYASLSLQEDPEIVRLACQTHGRALEYCPPGPTRQALTHDRQFMLEVVLANPGGGAMWKLLPSKLQKDDEELLLQALRHGLGMRDVPKDYWERPEFLQRAIQANSSLYLQLTAWYQSQFELALQAVIAPDSNPEIHSKALSHCPSLSQHRPVVLSICQRGHVDFVQEILQKDHDSVHPRFTDDLDVMKVAIQRDASLFSLASSRLQEMPEIILVSITPLSAWNTLKTVPATLQREHPEIPIRAIQLCLLRNLRYLPSHIPEDLWATHRALCMAWLQRGGRVLEAFERLLRNDVGLALAVAEYNWSEFYKVGEFLLANRNFVLQAVQRDGRVLRFVAYPLRQDFDILVMAVANHYKGLDQATPSHSSPQNNTTSLPNYNHTANHNPTLTNNDGMATNNRTRFLRRQRHRRLLNASNAPQQQEQQQQQQQQQQGPLPQQQRHNPPAPPSVAATLGGMVDLFRLERQIQTQLDLHKTFVDDFLRGIAISTPHLPPTLRSQLPMLDRGVETSQAFKRLIAEYLGIPIGPRLALLRRAFANLQRRPTNTTSVSASATNNPVSRHGESNAIPPPQEDVATFRVEDLYLYQHEQQQQSIRSAPLPNSVIPIQRPDNPFRPDHHQPFVRRYRLLENDAAARPDHFDQARPPRPPMASNRLVNEEADGDAMETDVFGALDAVETDIFSALEDIHAEAAVVREVNRIPPPAPLPPSLEPARAAARPEAQDILAFRDSDGDQVHPMRMDAGTIDSVVPQRRNQHQAFEQHHTNRAGRGDDRAIPGDQFFQEDSVLDEFFEMEYAL